jgi:hypothetical protein
MAPDHFCLVVAIWEFMAGMSLLFRRHEFLRWLEKLIQDVPKARILVSAWLAIGALAVKENPYPAADALGVLSLLAWVVMIKCALGVLWTPGLMGLAFRMLQKAPLALGGLGLLVSGGLFYVYRLL